MTREGKLTPTKPYSTINERSPLSEISPNFSSNRASELKPSHREKYKSMTELSEERFRRCITERNED